MKKVVITILALAMVGYGGYYVWENRHEVLFQGEDPYDVEDEVEVDEDAERILDEEEGFNVDINESEDDEEADEEEEFEGEEEYSTPVVTSENCDNKCEGFSGGELDYCNEICGFSEDDPDRESDDCEDLSDLKRDACFKQKAVDEKDVSICKKISDGALQENCENRVVEEILK